MIKQRHTMSVKANSAGNSDRVTLIHSFCVGQYRHLVTEAVVAPMRRCGGLSSSTSYKHSRRKVSGSRKTCWCERNLKKLHFFPNILSRPDVATFCGLFKLNGPSDRTLYWSIRKIQNEKRFKGDLVP